MAKIYLVRHCEAEGNVTRRMQGNAEALVTTRGYAQCECLRRRFEGVPIDAVYSSDAFRAIQTVLPLAEERGLRLRVSLALREIAAGAWEDTAWGNIMAEYPEAYRRWRQTPWDLITPGCNSFQEVGERLVCGLQAIAREIGPNGVAVAASHSCAIKAAQCLLLRKPMTELKEMGHGENTSVSLLHIDTDGTVQVEYRNDVSHLPPELRQEHIGVPPADINAAVYPARLPEQADVLLDLASQDAAQSRRPFSDTQWLQEAEALLRQHPGFLAIGYLHGAPCGFVRMELRDDLPAGCAVIRQLYVIPALQGRGYCEQLYGYAVHHLRYARIVDTALLPAHGSPDMERLAARFGYTPAENLGAYRSLYLFTPPCTYPLLF